jgi:hypothetical protein
MDTIYPLILMTDAAEMNDESFHIQHIYPNAEPGGKGGYVQNAVKPQGK